MMRTLPTLALLGALTAAGSAWQTVGRADTTTPTIEPTAAAQTADPATGLDALDPGARPVVADGPFAGDIHTLLAAATGPGRDAAVDAFRALGPDAFAALAEALRPTLDHYRAAKGFGFTEGAAALEPFIRLLDGAARQRDAYAAGLYWYTDLDAAKAQARATGRPILSLRMLGNLDEEYSCANSRFFRTVLYADEALGNTLRERFVLHWQSVRPVPVITIDMGDGRVIRRTITGNSCHLVLDAEGRPVDVIPGLYGARAFEQQVTRGAELVAWLNETDADERDALIELYHAKSAMTLDNRWLELTPTQPATISPKPFASEAEEMNVESIVTVETLFRPRQVVG